MKKGNKLLSLMCFRLLLSSFLVSAVTLNVNAEEGAHYISPRLQLGIHTEASMDSPIKALISSGTSVKVVKKEKEFSEIIAEDGAHGWIKSKFLTQTKPAELTVKELETALQSTKQQLATSLADISALKENQGVPASSDDEVINNQFQAYEETIKELKAELKAWEELDSQDKKAQQAKAEQINQHLKERLAKIAVMAMGEDVDIERINAQAFSASLVEHSDEHPFLKLFKKEYLFNVMIGGICFFLGIFLMDLINRRRHGGYRI